MYIFILISLFLNINRIGNFLINLQNILDNFLFSRVEAKILQKIMTADRLIKLIKDMTGAEHEQMGIGVVHHRGLKENEMAQLTLEMPESASASLCAPE